MGELEGTRSRIRIKMGDLEIEFEGSETMVKELLEAMKKDGLGKLSEIVAYSASTMPPLTQKTPQQIATAPSPEEKAKPTGYLSKHPETNQTLPDIAQRDLAGSEREWVLLYGYWTCEVEGKPVFGWADLNAKYKESGRYSKNREAQISNNVNRCIKKEWFTKLTDNTYSLKPDGKAKALEIIHRKSAPKKKTTQSKKKTKPKTSKVTK